MHWLLGTCRDRIPAYFSSAHHDTAQAYADEALYWQEQGWKQAARRARRGSRRGVRPLLGVDIVGVRGAGRGS